MPHHASHRLPLHCVRHLDIEPLSENHHQTVQNSILSLFIESSHVRSIAGHNVTYGLFSLPAHSTGRGCAHFEHSMFVVVRQNHTILSSDHQSFSSVSARNLSLDSQPNIRQSQPAENKCSNMHNFIISNSNCDRITFKLFPSNFSKSVICFLGLVQHSTTAVSSGSTSTI